jgi:hypothetical protein
VGVIGGQSSLTTGALVLDYPRAVPPLLLIEVVGFPLAVIALVAVLWRLSWRRYDRNPLNRRVEGVPVGSAADLVDAGSIPWPNMLDVLTVVRVDGDAERTADHPTAGDNPFAEVLGLRSPYTTKQEPNLMYGERHGHQVFIRMGIDETRRSGMTRRHMREITVVRAETPVFELRGEGGTLSFEPGAPAGIRAVVEPLAPAPGVWDELRVVGGAAGIVATRPLEGRWLYDLWLLERMAASLAAPALPPARLGPSFKVPYGLGRE